MALSLTVALILSASYDSLTTVEAQIFIGLKLSSHCRFSLDLFHSTNKRYTIFARCAPRCVHRIDINIHHRPIYCSRRNLLPIRPPDVERVVSQHQEIIIQAQYPKQNYVSGISDMGCVIGVGVFAMS
jgi:hypothetical protein